MVEGSGKGSVAVMEALRDSPGSLVMEIGSFDSERTDDDVSVTLGTRFVGLDVAVGEWIGFVTLHLCLPGSETLFEVLVFLPGGVRNELTVFV